MARSLLSTAARVACALAVVSLSACVGEDVEQNYQSQSATLTLHVTPPPGVSTELVLTGPNKFVQLIDAGSVVLDGLTPGAYALTVPPIVVPTSLVDTVWADDAAAGTFTLSASEAVTKDIDYAARLGSGSLWLSQFGDARSLGSWPVASLMAGLNPAAPAQLLTSYAAQVGLALDGQGSIWLLANDLQTSSFVVFGASQLVNGQSQPTPKLLQAGGRLDAFCLDADGGIFGASQTEKSLDYWSPATVASGNLLGPDVTLQGASGALDAPIGLALDATGSLWVVSAGTANTSGSLARFEPRQLAASGYYLPTVQISVDAPGPLAFDATGNLWIVSGGNSLLEYEVAQLGGVHAEAPALALALDADATANSIAFDAIGDLWISLHHATDNSSALVMLTPGQLAKTAAPTAFVALQTQSGRGGASLLLVDPTPAVLPLAGIPK
jgi:hypothetical protein